MPKLFTVLIIFALLPFCGMSQCTGSLPSLIFSDQLQLKEASWTQINSIAQQIKNTPECKIKAQGHGSSSKVTQQLSWSRVNAVIRHFVEKQGISPSRFIFEYGNEGDPNTVDLVFTNEDGPSTVPSPHPNLRNIQEPSLHGPPSNSTPQHKPKFRPGKHNHKTK